jgi:hypothetical protein
MMRHRNIRRLSIVGLALISGCAAPLDEPTSLRPYKCPTWQCGFNSAEVNGRSIRELNLDGLANADGVRLVEFVEPAGVAGDYALDVEGDALIARSTEGEVLVGAQLVGAALVVQGPLPLDLPVTITIAGYEEIPSWAEGAPPVPTYALLYPDVEAALGDRNVCVGDLTDVLATAAVVLGGETYDLDSKSVDADRPRWLTIGCAGSAVAKLRLLNYGPQSDFDGEGEPATPAQRQATLKMLTADYCGGGDSYTNNGVPLRWENQSGTAVSAGTAGALEAVWSADGALCLDEPRLAGTMVACALPSCAGFSLADGEWASYVPKPYASTQRRR